MNNHQQIVQKSGGNQSTATSEQQSRTYITPYVFRRWPSILVGSGLLLAAGAGTYWFWTASKAIVDIGTSLTFFAQNTLSLFIFLGVVAQALVYVSQRKLMYEQWLAMQQQFGAMQTQSQHLEGQLNKTEEALRIERSKTDPRLRVSNVRMKDFKAGQSPIFITTIANEGLIDATGVELHIGVRMGEEKEFNWIEPQTVMIPARGRESYPIVSGAILNEKLIEGFNTDVPIEVKVQVKYFPGSPNEPKESCYRYLPWRGDRPDDVPEFVPCDFKPHLNVVVHLKGAEIKIPPGTVRGVVGRVVQPPPAEVPNEGEGEEDKGNPN